MYETREGPHATKSHAQQHDNRTANSMYQMNEEEAQKSATAEETGADHSTAASATTNGCGPLPHSEDVKHRTEVVTRRIQELWSVMQEMTSNDVFVPGADRIRAAVAELTALFPAVKTHFFFSFNRILHKFMLHFDRRFLQLFYFLLPFTEHQQRDYSKRYKTIESKYWPFTKGLRWPTTFNSNQRYAID